MCRWPMQRLLRATANRQCAIKQLDHRGRAGCVEKQHGILTVTDEPHVMPCCFSRMLGRFCALLAQGRYCVGWYRSTRPAITLSGPGAFTLRRSLRLKCAQLSHCPALVLPARTAQIGQYRIFVAVGQAALSRGQKAWRRPHHSRPWTATLACSTPVAGHKRVELSLTALLPTAVLFADEVTIRRLMAAPEGRITQPHPSVPHVDRTKKHERHLRTTIAEAPRQLG